MKRLALRFAEGSRLTGPARYTRGHGSSPARAIHRAGLPSRTTEQDYDVFLSYATEDRKWCEQLAERLRDAGVRVCSDVQAGNAALQRSRKLVAVWSKSYFREDKLWKRAERFERQRIDLLNDDRPLIPVLIEDCSDKAPSSNLRCVDFRDLADFELRFRQLVQALDLPVRELLEEPAPLSPEHDRFRAERGRAAHFRGKRFEDEVATLYRLLGYEVTKDTQVAGIQIDLQVRKSEGTSNFAIVECKRARLTAKERDQLIAQQAVAQKKLPKYRSVAVSAEGFAADTRTALEEVGFDCYTYLELLGERPALPCRPYRSRIHEAP